MKLNRKVAQQAIEDAVAAARHHEHIALEWRRQLERERARVAELEKKLDDAAREIRGLRHDLILYGGPAAGRVGW